MNYLKRMNARDALSTASAGQLKLFNFALIVLLVLSVASCRSQKTMTASGTQETKNEMLSDSTVEEIKWQETVKVPMSEVTLEIPMDSLRSLPDGAVYTARKGQAGVKVYHRGQKDNKPETIYVYSSCDSLQLQCMRYEKTISNMKQQLAAHNSQNTVSEHHPNAFIKSLKWFFLGFIAGGIITIVLIITLKKK